MTSARSVFAGMLDDDAMQIDQAIRFSLIAEQVAKRPCRLLEVGCGSVELAAYFAAAGHRVDACDRGAVALGALKRLAGVRYFRADGAALQCKDHAYGCVVSSDVLDLANSLLPNLNFWDRL